MICKCKIIKQVYSNNNYQVLGCVPIQNSDVKLNKYHNFTIVGDLGMLEVGNEYELELEEKESKYGGYEYHVISIPSFNSYNITDIESLDKDSEYELLKTIMTDSQAKSVNEAYPNFIRLILKGEESNIDYSKIYNVGAVRIKSYIIKINSLFKYLKIMNDNKKLDLTYSEAVTLCKKYGNIESTQKQIDDFPYMILIDVLNRSFNASDKKILEIWPELKNSDQRCEYAILKFLKENEKDGNTRIKGNELAKYVGALDMELVKKMKNVAIESNKIYYNEKEKDLSIMNTFLDECYIANSLYGKINNPRILNIEYKKYQNTDINLTDEQMEIMNLVCNYDIALLIGGSGTGKSSSMKALVNMLEDNNLTYTLVAPTGIASKRLKETTGRNSSTIHKRIMSGNLIDTDVLIIDEFSMLSVNLFAQLLRDTLDYTKIVLVCDNEQLASISCGNVLQNILDSKKIPTAKLTKVFRYGKGGIATVGTDARNGILYLNKNGTLKSINMNDINDYKFVPIGEDPLSQIFEEYKKLTQIYKPKDILVLSPFNVGSFGSYAINAKIQAEYNPPKTNENFVIRKMSDAPNGKIIFRIGDKVINTSNNYNAKTKELLDYEKYIKEAEYEVENAKEIDGENSEYYYKKYDKLNEIIENSPQSTSVMNGDIGFIVDIDNESNIYIKFDEEIVVYDKSDLQNLLLGYAISIHKCVTGDTLIYTNYGIKNISEIVNNHEEWENKQIQVYNNNYFENPISYYKNPPQECIKITTNNGYSIESTLDHSLFIQNERGEIVKTEAKNIKCNDYIALVKNSNAFATEYVTYTYNNKTFYVDENMGMLLGMMLVGGEIDNSNHNIIYRNSNTEILYRYFDLIKSLRIDKIKSKNIKINKEIIQIHSEHICKILNDILKLEDKEKDIPECILSSPRNVVSKMIDGILMHYHLENCPTVEIENQPISFLRHLQILMLNLGIITKLSEKENKLYIDYENMNSLNIFLDKVISIVPTIKETYCLEMPESHTFTQNGFFGGNCQGTESPAVMMITHPSHSRMLTKNLLYVGLTRAKEMLVEIGDIDAISIALTKSETRIRNTWLYDLIMEKWEENIKNDE